MLVRWTQPAADDLLHICDYTTTPFYIRLTNHIWSATPDIAQLGG